MRRSGNGGSCPGLRGAIAATVLSLASVSAAQELDDSWTVTVNGQATQVNPDGSFFVLNISAADLFGPDGPGSSPDFLSDDFVRLIAHRTVGGATEFAWSEPFRFEGLPGDSEPFVIGELTFGSVPPLPVDLLISLDFDTLPDGGIGQITALARLADGSVIDVTLQSEGTIYRTTDPAVAYVDPTGAVFARSPGEVVVVASNLGAVASTQLSVTSQTIDTVVEGFVRLDDGTFVANADVFTSTGGQATTDSGGRFSMPLSASSCRTLSVFATADVNGEHHAGSAGEFELLADAVTDAGILRLRPRTPGVGLPQPSFPLSFPALAAASGDVNADGLSDLVVSTQDVNATSVDLFLNQGGGFFSGPAQIDTGSRPVGLAFEDLDGDLDLDLVVTLRNVDKLAVLLNSGTGTFDPPVLHDCGQRPEALVVADIDGDGIADAVAVNPFANQVTVLIGLGNGGFQNPQPYPVGAQPTALALGDVEGDGDLDLAVANTGSSDVSVLLNDGAGNLGSENRYPGSLFPSVAFDDVTGEGWADLVLTNSGGAGQVEVSLARGDGTLDVLVDYPVGQSPASVATPDVDGDGFRDLVVGNRTTSDLSVLLNLKDGTFADEFRIPSVPGMSLVVDNFDAVDGPDLAVAGETGRLSVLFDDAAGSLQASTTLPFANRPEAIVREDLDGDADLDLAVIRVFADEVVILSNAGDGSFQETAAYATGFGPTSVVTADLDGSGTPDLIVTDDFHHNVWIYLNQGDGSFALSGTTPAGTRPVAAAAGDLDGDGDLDLAVANSGSNDVTILLNLGDGTFVQLGDVPMRRFPSDVVLFHADADCNLDLAVTNRDEGSMSILLGNGDATFQTQALVSARTPLCLVAADLDRDGDTDLAAGGGAFSGIVTVLINDGNGRFFTGRREYSTGALEDIHDLSAADLDGDQHRDLVGAGIGAIPVLLNVGDGTFVSRGAFVAHGKQRAFGLAAGDLDGDGTEDVVCTNGGGNTLTIFLNRAAR